MGRSRGEVTERDRFWVEHEAAIEASGQTAKAYAAEHGLSLHVSRSQGLGNELIDRYAEDYSGRGSIECRERLGGLVVCQKPIDEKSVLFQRIDG